MAKAKLTVDEDLELRLRITVAAAVQDESRKEWVERALLREFEEKAGMRVPLNEGIPDYYPAVVAKPGGGEGRQPRPSGGCTVADAIIEDRW